MILWGGIVYLTAGGTPERIKSAKDYISNALVGLVLLFTSYLLLQTLNPDLVKLQMPRVYMLRPISLGAEFCKDTKVPDSEKFAKVTDKPADYVPQKSDYTVFKKDTWCKEAYMWETGTNQTCWGSKCPSNLACAPKEGATEKAFECIVAAITGTITYTEDAFIDNDVDFHVVCVDGKHPKIADSNATDAKTHPQGTQLFAVPMIPQLAKGAAIRECGSSANVKGFYLSIEVDDPGGGLKEIAEGALIGGVISPVGAIVGATVASMGTDDYFAVGSNGSQPIYQTITKEGKQVGETDPDHIDWTKIDPGQLIPPDLANTDKALDSNKQITTSRKAGFFPR